MPEETFDFDTYLPLRLTVLSHRVTRTMARSYGPRYALSVAEWRVLAVLGHYGALSIGDIAAHTAMNRARVGRTVTRLMDHRYLSRRFGQTDWCRGQFELTPAGAALYRQIVPLVRAQEAAMLDPLSEEERAVLARVVDKLDAAAALLAREDAEAAAAADAPRAATPPAQISI